MEKHHFTPIDIRIDLLELSCCAHSPRPLSADQILSSQPRDNYYRSGGPPPLEHTHWSSLISDNFPFFLILLLLSLLTMSNSHFIDYQFHQLTSQKQLPPNNSSSQKHFKHCPNFALLPTLQIHPSHIHGEVVDHDRKYMLPKTGTR